MTAQDLPRRTSVRSVSLAFAAPAVAALVRRIARSARKTIVGIGGTIWAIVAHRRAFDRMAARLNGDLFNSPVLWADVSAKAWDQAWRSSERAGNLRLPLGAGALAAAIGLFAFIVSVAI